MYMYIHASSSLSPLPILSLHEARIWISEGLMGGTWNLSRSLTSMGGIPGSIKNFQTKIGPEILRVRIDREPDQKYETIVTAAAT